MITTTTTEYQRGAAVLITADRMGTIARPGATRFTDHEVQAGTTARYVEPMHGMPEAGWHLLEVLGPDAGALYCPAHESHFQLSADDSGTERTQ